MSTRIIVFALLAASGLFGCAHRQQLVVHTLTPPPLLTQPVLKPRKPNPETATQKDVAVYLVELNAALDLANFKLQMIDEWSNHEKTNGFRLRKLD